MPRAIDPRGVPEDRRPNQGMAGPIPDFGWSKARDAVDDPFKFFVENLFEQIKKYTGIDLFWMLDWSWTTNSLLELARQANDLFAWLQNPVQRPPNLLTRPSFSSPSAIAEAEDWSWDAVVSLGSVTALSGRVTTDPQGSARTTADGSRHAMMSNAITDKAALTPGQILTCQVHALVEAGFTASDDQAIRLEIVPSRYGVLQDAVVLAHCGVPDGDPGDWIAAPTGSKAVFFDVDYTIPTEDSPDTVELRLVVDESAGGNVPVRFDGARCAAAGGFLVVLSDLFDAGRAYLTDMWDAIVAWLDDVFDPAAWSTLTAATDAAFELFVKRVKRALRHADADTFHPPTTSSMLSNALRGNQWFGWLFEMVDNWLQPVLNTGKAAADFGQACWDAVTVFVSAPGAAGAWSTLTSTIESAWNTMVDAIFAAWGSPRTHSDIATPATATETALRNNAWFGWLFDLVDDWLQPVLNIGKAVTDFGDACWKAITTFSAHPSASGAWTTMVNAINSAWNTMVDAILAAWGSSKTHADFASPAAATEAAIKNNPVTGWLWGNSFDGGNWLDDAIHAITDPIGNFFDQVRRYINQMIEGLHWGYFDENWAWVPSLTTPDTEVPGSGTVMTPGRNDDDQTGIAPSVDTSIPAAPTGLAAVPWLDFSVTGFPAGNITYAVAAMKGSIEGPAVKVSCFAGTLFPPNCSAHVDLGWYAVTGATSYKIYRKVDATYQATDWRLIDTVSSAYSYLSPYQDKAARSAGTVAHPKSDAELAAQIVTNVKSTATGAAATAGSAQSTASSAASTASAAQTAASAASDAASAASNQAAVAIAKFNAVPEANIVVANVDPQVVPEDWGVGFKPITGGIVSASTASLSGDGNMSGTTNTVRLRLPSGFKAKAVLIFLSWTTGNDKVGESTGGLYPSVYTGHSVPNFVSLADKGRIFRTASASAGGCSVLMASNVNVSSALDLYVGLRAGQVYGNSVYTLDAWMVAVDGSLSGDFGVTSDIYPLTSLSASSDSAAIVHNSLFRYESTSDLTISASSAGMDVSHSMSNLQGLGGGGLPVVHSAVALTRNIDDDETLSITTTPTAGNSTSSNGVVGVGIGIVVKSLPQPQTDTVGSFAEISTANPNAFTQAVGSYSAFTRLTEVLRFSPDIEVDGSTASFTVSYIGTYDVDVDLLCNETHDMTLGIAINGTVVVARRCSGYSMSISTKVYAKEGDTISLLVKNNASGNITLDTLSRMSISLVNRSYL